MERMAAVGRSLVDQDSTVESELSPEERVSRGLKRLVAREQNEVLKLLWELKSAQWKGTERIREAGHRTEKRRKSEATTDDDETGSREVVVGRKREVRIEEIKVES